MTLKQEQGKMKEVATIVVKVRQANVGCKKIPIAFENAVTIPWLKHMIGFQKCPIFLHE